MAQHVRQAFQPAAEFFHEHTRRLLCQVCFTVSPPYPALLNPGTHPSHAEFSA
jgi:hypothetical protein